MEIEQQPEDMMGPQPAEGAAGQTPEVKIPPGVSQEQAEAIRRIGLAAQTILSTGPHNAKIVEMASSGEDGIVTAAAAILSLINERAKLSKEMIGPAAVTVLMVLADFLVYTGRMRADPGLVGRLIGKLLARIAPQYGISADELREMTRSAPSEQRRGMNAEAARRGLLGKLMQRV